jgi:L-asparaginase/Glu-tRNA(Gln) amidotransferase subunit D
MSAERKPRITVIGARGTIAGVAPSRVGYREYDSGRLPAQDLVDALRPEVDALGEVSAADLGGEHKTLEGLARLSHSVDATLEEADAVVVTTGTGPLQRPRPENRPNTLHRPRPHAPSPLRSASSASDSGRPGRGMSRMR